MNKVLMWIAINLLLIMTWSGAVGQSYLPFTHPSMLWGMLIITLLGLSNAVLELQEKEVVTVDTTPVKRLSTTFGK